MKKEIIIIGGGIVGSTAAFYLSKHPDYHVTMIDKGIGTATRAAAGIICPWLSQRQNKDWYNLTSKGAAFYSQLMQDLSEAGIDKLPYMQTGTLVFKNKPALAEKLYHLAHLRKEQAPVIGEISICKEDRLNSLIPQLETEQTAVLTSGGGRLDGAALLDNLQDLFQQNGGNMVQGTASLHDHHSISINDKLLTADYIILASGAWLPQLLEPLGYQVDIRPQKGQLLEVQTDLNTNNWPGLMLHGEIDILPFDSGKLVIGATHENEKGYDISIDHEKINEMKNTAQEHIPALSNYPISNIKVGTRAYSSDYLPFYGTLKHHPHLWVASGLGSSGLTSGPFIGWQIAKEILKEETCFNRENHSPDLYIQSID